MIHRFCVYLNLRVNVLVRSLSNFFTDFTGLFKTCSFFKNLPIIASGAGGIRKLGLPQVVFKPCYYQCTAWPGSVSYQITMFVHETKQSLLKRSRVLPNFGAERIGFMLIRIKKPQADMKKDPTHK